MVRPLLFLIASLALSAPAFAQRIQGHVVGGFGGLTCCRRTEALGQLGFGVEGYINQRVGIGGDITAAVDSFEAVGIGSVVGIYRVRRTPNANVYISGGFSHASSEPGSGEGGINVGGGVDWWRFRRVGFRFEPRYYGFALNSRPVHMFVVRIGIVFGGGRD